MLLRVRISIIIRGLLRILLAITLSHLRLLISITLSHLRLLIPLTVTISIHTRLCLLISWVITWRMPLLLTVLIGLFLTIIRKLLTVTRVCVRIKSIVVVLHLNYKKFIYFFSWGGFEYTFLLLGFPNIWLRNCIGSGAWLRFWLGLGY